MWLQGFATSATNPKAIAIFAALFPQFAILSATYIALDALFLSTYAYAADWIGQKFTGANRIWIHRAGGGVMILAALLLGGKTRAEK